MFCCKNTITINVNSIGDHCEDSDCNDEDNNENNDKDNDDDDDDETRLFVTLRYRNTAGV